MKFRRTLDFLIKFAGFLLLVSAGHYLAFKLVNVPGRFETVTVIFILSLYPVIRNPGIGVYLIFILIPFVPFIRRLYYLKYARPDIDPFLALQEMLLAAVILGFFFQIKDIWQRFPGIRRYMLVIIIYVMYMLSRVFIFNYNPVLNSLLSFKFYGPPALFFIVGIACSENKKLLKNIWIITVVIGVFGALYGFKQLYTGYSEAEKIWFSSIEFSSLFIKGVARPFSIYKAPVAFADYMQLSIIGVMVLSFLSKNERIKAAMLLIPLYFFASLITSVRSSWIGVAVSLVFWQVFFRLKNMGSRIVVIAVIALLFMIINLSADLFSTGMGTSGIFSVMTKTLPGGDEYVDLLITSRSEALYNPLKEHSMVSRLVLWRTLLLTATDLNNIFVGRGLGTLKADSLYLTYLAEFGYPGMIFIIILFAVFIRRASRVTEISRDIETVSFAKGVVIMNVVLFVISITGSHIHSFPGSVYFWFWNGVIIAKYCRESSRGSKNLENINHT